MDAELAKELIGRTFDFYTPSPLRGTILSIHGQWISINYYNKTTFINSHNMLYMIEYLPKNKEKKNEKKSLWGE